MPVYKCAADGCYAQVDEKGAMCENHRVVDHLSPEEYAHLASVLSSAELRDYIGVEILGNGVREWGRKSDKAHQNITPRLRSAREKLAENTSD